MRYINRKYSTVLTETDDYLQLVADALMLISKPNDYYIITRDGEEGYESSNINLTSLIELSEKNGGMVVINAKTSYLFNVSLSEIHEIINTMYMVIDDPSVYMDDVMQKALSGDYRRAFFTEKAAVDYAHDEWRFKSELCHVYPVNTTDYVSQCYEILTIELADQEDEDKYWANVKLDDLHSIDDLEDYKLYLASSRRMIELEINSDKFEDSSERMELLEDTWNNYAELIKQINQKIDILKESTKDDYEDIFDDDDMPF